MKLTVATDELDFAQKSTLNKDFWQDEKLNPEVRKVILAIVKNYLQSTNLEIDIDDVDEIEFTGSLANYNHNKFSDVDIHLLFDFSKLGKDPDFMRELLVAKAINWNDRHNVTIFGHEVELYITDAGTDHHSTGVYSVKDDEWLVKPVRDPKLSAELNLNKVKDKADKISKKIDMLVVKDELSYDALETLKDKIRKMREAGLETGGEYSTENLAFKLLRRRGELNTLYSLMNQAQDAELSLDEDIEWWKKRRSLDNKNYRELMGHINKKSNFKRKYAGKNIGYPKSVSRKKISKMGPPYDVDPPMKLPKSGPPGVGALEEENNLTEDKIPDSLKSAFDKIKNATMKFQVLKPAKGTLGFITAVGFIPGKTYTATITGNDINFPKTEKFAMTKTKAEFLNDLETKNQGQFCDILNCKTSTITTGGKTQTLEKFIASVMTPQVKPAVKKQQVKKSDPLYDKPGVYNVLGSGEPGQISQSNIKRILTNLLKYRRVGDLISLSFRDIDDTSGGGQNKCLKPHSFTVRYSDPQKEEYTLSLDQKSYKNIVHPDNMINGQYLVDIEPCLPNQSENFKLNVVQLYNFIKNYLVAGQLSKIDVYLEDEDLAPGATKVSYIGREEQEKIDKQVAVQRQREIEAWKLDPVNVKKSKFRRKIEKTKAVVFITPVYNDTSFFINYSNALSTGMKTVEKVYKDVEQDKLSDALKDGLAGVFNAFSQNIIFPENGKNGMIKILSATNSATIKTQSVASSIAGVVREPAVNLLMNYINENIKWEKYAAVKYPNFDPNNPPEDKFSQKYIEWVATKAKYEASKLAFEEFKKSLLTRKSIASLVKRLLTNRKTLTLPLNEMLRLIDVQSDYDVCKMFDCKKTIIRSRFVKGTEGVIKPKDTKTTGVVQGTMTLEKFLELDDDAIAPAAIVKAKVKQKTDVQKQTTEPQKKEPEVTVSATGYIRVATEEYTKFDQGKLKEGNPKAWKLIAELWRVGAKDRKIYFNTLSGMEYGFITTGLEVDGKILNQREIIQKFGRDKAATGTGGVVLPQSVMTKKNIEKFYNKYKNYLPYEKEQYIEAFEGNDYTCSSYWSSAFINYCMRGDSDFQTLLRKSPIKNRGNHKSYWHAGAENVVRLVKKYDEEIKAGKSESDAIKSAIEEVKSFGKWIFIRPAVAKAMKYKQGNTIGKVGDIVMVTMSGSMKRLHGDIKIDPNTRVGGNVRDTVYGKTRNINVGGVVTKNEEALRSAIELFKTEYNSNIQSFKRANYK
jgi:hypothetical protein